MHRHLVQEASPEPWPGDLASQEWLADQ